MKGPRREKLALLYNRNLLAKDKVLKMEKNSLKFKNASEVLAAHWDGYLPVDIVAIAKKTNIEIKVRNDISQCGLIEKIDDKFTIYISEKEAELRRRFAIAHCLGWCLLGLGGPADTLLSVSSDNFSSSTKSPEGRICNAFAKDLLIPEKMPKYLLDHKKVSSLQELCTLFKVAPALMKWRLQELDLI